MKPGDVWIVHIPELGTHEQSGVRPAVIVARVTKTIVTVIPCTSNMTALRFPYTHLVEQTKGMDSPLRRLHSSFTCALWMSGI